MTATPSASPTEDVEEVAPGVHRIPVVLPNEGLRSVNVYALVDADGVDLVDCGMNTDESEAALLDGLVRIGRDIGDVRNVFVTHHHLDHYTLAISLRRRHGFTVHLGEGERVNLRAVREVIANGAERSFEVDMHRIGFADDLRKLAKPDAPEIDASAWEDPDRWMHDGDTLDSPSRRLTAIATPGHTQGHMVFHDANHGLLFAGDHVLPRITPSIGFESSGRPRSALHDFLTSLELVLGMPDARLFPAHGQVQSSAHTRARELLAHHDLRLTATDAVLRAAKYPSTAFDVARQLLWTRRNRVLEDLNPFDGYLAAAETAAHLDLLVERGLARMEPPDGGPDLYRTRTHPAQTDDHTRTEDHRWL